jgi:hypothetical protein
MAVALKMKVVAVAMTADAEIQVAAVAAAVAAAADTNYGLFSKEKMPERTAAFITTEHSTMVLSSTLPTSAANPSISSAAQA